MRLVFSKSFLVFSFLLSLFVVFFLAVAPVLAEHDNQRVGQIALGLISAFSIFTMHSSRMRFSFISQCPDWWIFLFISAGVGSVLLAHQLAWAVADACVLVTCCCIAGFYAGFRRVVGVSADRVFWCFLLLLCSVKSVQFIVSMLAAFLSDARQLDTDLLIVGFSNKRFYGQFQTFTLPILVLPLLLTEVKRSAKICIFSLLACWWMIAICGGTRGTWLGMSCSAAILLACGASGRRWLCWQLSAVGAGLLLFWYFFRMLPEHLGIEVINFAGDRLTTSLSARDIIWQQAWEMIKERPILGFGPMHFADIHNPVAAHPHQAILQWACEWGVPSTLMLGWLVVRGLFSTFRLILQKASSSEPIDLLRICLFASLVGALAQSMVDGVIVMPYSQIWMAIVVGWLMGIHEWPAKPRFRRTLHLGWMATMFLAIGFLGYVVARDYPHLDDIERQYAADFGGRFQPRFWMQGIIAKPGPSLLEPPEAARFSTQSPK